MIVCPDEKKGLILDQLEDLKLYNKEDPDKSYTNIFYFDEGQTLLQRFVPCLRKK